MTDTKEGAVQLCVMVAGAAVLADAGLQVGVGAGVLIGEHDPPAVRGVGGLFEIVRVVQDIFAAAFVPHKWDLQS